MNKVIFRPLSLLLVLSLLIQLLPVAVFAEENAVASAAEEAELYATDRPETPQEALASATILFEEESLREESVKHFRLDDGNYVAIRYGTPVHYEDDGQWEEYDNTLLPITAQGTGSVTGYRVVNGDSIRLFAADTNAEVLLAAQKGNYGLSMTPIREPDAELPIVPDQPVVANGSITQNSEATLIPAEILATAAPAAQTIEDPLLAQVQPDKLYSALEYPAAFHGASLRYENYGSMMKESIVISAPQTEYSYAFALQTEGLTPTLQADGSILLAAPDGTVVYAIPTPYMVDANEGYSYDAAYTLTGSGSSYILTVTADADWINAEGRAFPVLLDPTIVEFSTNDTMISATYVRQGTGDNSAVASNPDPVRTGLYAGALDITSSNPNGLTRSYFHVNNGFINIPIGGELMVAYLYLYQIAYQKKAGGSDTLELGIYSLDMADGLDENTNTSSDWADWAQQLTWNKAEDTNLTVRNTTLIDKQTLSSATTSDTEPVIWDITSMAFEWYQDQTTNLGFVLMATDEASVSSRAAFASPNTVYDTPPAMVIVYRNTVGVEGHYSSQTLDIGRAGKLYITDFSMQGTLETPLIASSSNVMPFGLSLIYNTAYQSRLFGADGGMNTKPFTSMRFGGGWKLSAQETMIKQALIDNPSSAADYCLIHTDADGTEHYYFYDTDEESSSYGYYASEEGLRYKIEDDAPDFYMTDEFGNTKFFGDGFLKWVEDAYDNKISYNYTNSGQLDTITRQNKGKSVETLADFEYFSTGEAYPNFLKSVTDEAGRVTLFGYEILTDPSGSHTAITCLKTITFPDGQVVEYSYMEDPTFFRWAKISSVYDRESNYGIEFSYSYNQDLNNFYEYVVSGTSRIYGAKMHGYKRSRSQSVYRYYGKDGISQEGSATGDDLLTFLVFDQVGRTISSYTTDHTETHVFGTGAAVYMENSGTSKKNNRIIAGASAGRQGVNLLQNASFEQTGTGINLKPGWVTTNNASHSTTAYLGNYGLRFFRSVVTTAKDTWHQSVTLEPDKTYTFSGYVYVPADVNFSGNGGIYLAFRDSNGNILKQSETVNYATAGINNGWIRLSVCYENETEAALSAQVAICAFNYSGAIYADACQLEQEDAASTFNLVEDGSFEQATALPTSSATAWYKTGNAVLAGKNGSYFGDKTVQLSGSGFQRISRSIPLNVPLDTTFLLSGWAKGSADPESVAEKTVDTDPYFGLVLRFYYSDGTSEVHYQPFDLYYSGWQYTQLIAVPEKAGEGITITSVVIVAAYDNNINTAYLDNISFRMEPAQTYDYDDNGNLISAAQTGTGSNSSEYAENGVDLLEHHAANGTTYNYTYNAAHDVVSATSDGVTAGYTYDANGNMTSSTINGTDEDNDPISMTSSASYEALSGRNLNGNHTSTVTDTAGNTTSYYYQDSKEILEYISNAKGQETHYAYNASNDRVNMVYQSGIAAVTYTYDGAQLSQLDRKTFRGSNNTEQHQYYNFAYNIWGQNTSVKVGTLPLATYEYADINGNTAGTGGGLLTKMTYGNGDSVTYTYDEFDRLKKVVYNDTGNYIEYLYTADGALGELHYMTSANAIIASYSFEYDSLGRLIRSNEYNGSGLVQRTEHLYDSVGRLHSQSWMIGDSPFTESYIYNDPDPAVANDTGDGSLLQMTTAAEATIDYRYDGLNRLKGTTVTPEDASTALYTTAYAYEDAESGGTTNQVEFRNVRNPDGSLIDGYMYEYDELGNITGIFESEVKIANQPRRQLAAYEYDSQNQLLSETIYIYGDIESTEVDESVVPSMTPSETIEYEYTYDTAGNILTESKNGTVTKTYTYGNSQWNDLLTEYNGEKIAYEGQTYVETTSLGGATSFLVQGTATSGNPISYYNGHRYDLQWQQGRNLTQSYFEIEDHTARKPIAWVDEENTIVYSYDGDGIRTSKSVTTNTYFYRSGSLGGEVGTMAADPNSYSRYLANTELCNHFYVTQNGKVVQERLVNTETLITQTFDFIYDESGKPFALKYTNNGTTTSTTAIYYYVLNLQGDVVGLLDSSGTCVARYSYNAWGEILSVTSENGLTITDSTHIANLNPLRYRGYYYDTETGFYYLQSRYYDPVTHRFINADSLASTGHGFTGTNMFAYCNNRPVMYSDPTGHISKYASAALFVGGSAEQTSYDGDAAVSYAKIWACNPLRIHNPNFYSYTTDCTNFVSQCLLAGGFCMTDQWHMYQTGVASGWKRFIPHRNYLFTWDVTLSWSVASELREYLISSCGFEEISISSEYGIGYAAAYGNIHPGDVIFFNNGSEENDGWHHAAIVTRVEGGMIYYAAHTTDVYNKPLSEGIGDEVVSIVRINIGG